MRIPCIPVWIKAMLTAVILVLLVKTFAFTSCTIPSTGMENSLYQGERVLVNKWSYGFRVPFSIWRWLGKLPGKGILCCSTILIHGLLRRRWAIGKCL